jgi:hypothetical protein
VEAAFFDLDKTIISRSSSLALSRPMYRAGMVAPGQLVRGAYAQLVYALVGSDEKKMDRLKEGMFQLTRGLDRHEVERTRRVAQELRRCRGWIRRCLSRGPYDVIAIVEAVSTDALGKMVVSR